MPQEESKWMEKKEEILQVSPWIMLLLPSAQEMQAKNVSYQIACCLPHLIWCSQSCSETGPQSPFQKGYMYILWNLPVCVNLHVRIPREVPVPEACVPLAAVGQSAPGCSNIPSSGRHNPTRQAAGASSTPRIPWPLAPSDSRPQDSV